MAGDGDTDQRVPRLRRGRVRAAQGRVTGLSLATASPAVIGLGFGLGAAVSYGASSYLSAIVARQFGGWITNLGEQAGVATFLILLAPFLIPVNRPGPLIILMILGIGAVMLLVTIASYQLLAVAPVALIWPLLASNSALVSLLAIIFLGERQHLLAWIGIVLVMAGVLATTYVRSQVYEPAVGVAFFSREPGRSLEDPPTRASTQTLLLAVAIAVVSGIGLFFLIIQIKQYGWYLPFALERASQATLALALFAAGFPPRRDLRSHPFRWWVLLPLIGIIDGIGLGFYGLGNQYGSTSVTSMSSSAFVVVPVLLGVFLIGERPQRTQWLGIGCVVLGLVLLGA